MVSLARRAARGTRPTEDWNGDTLVVDKRCAVNRGSSVLATHFRISQFHQRLLRQGARRRHD